MACFGGHSFAYIVCMNLCLPLSLVRFARVAVAVVSVGTLVLACGGTTEDGSTDPSSQDDLVTAKALVGNWALDLDGDTDGVPEWWDQLSLNADKTFTGSEGAN